MLRYQNLFALIPPRADLTEASHTGGSVVSIRYIMSCIGVSYFYSGLLGIALFYLGRQECLSF